jgi:Pyruvate/2-oxoacid:ferredoxin oxidoreductase delta subunit
MTEAVYSASGLGLPIVMTLGNRAIGAPINIWNDHSDAMSMRDAGWMQLFAETNREAVDLHIQAFRLPDAPKTVRPMLETVRRRTTFEELTQGLDPTNALYEARRCLSCGNCFECDNCYGVWPDNAVIKLGPGYRFKFNYDFCKGCALCAQECPCGS